MDVLFQAGHSFTIHGLLTAVGTEEEIIVFRNQDEDDTWGSIRFLADSDDESIIAFAHITGGNRQGAWREHVSWGGGIFIDSCDPTISHCLIEDNVCSGWGGGIAVHRAEPLLEFNVIRDNRARNGAIGIHSGSPTIDNNLICNNWGEYNGGINLTLQCDPLISNNQIVENASQSLEWGTGIYMDFGATATITGNLIARNLQGAVFLGADCTVDEFVNNTLADNGGRCAILLYDNCRLEIRNCIVWGHGDPAWLVEGCTLVADFSDFEDAEDEGIQVGEGVIDEDPLFIDAGNLDYHLNPDSPCIDTGDPEMEPDPDGSRSDMGCFPFIIPINLEITPEEINFGPVGYEVDVGTELQLAYLSDDEEAEPISVQIQPNQGDDWMTANPDDEIMEPNDTLIVEINVHIPDDFEVGETQSQLNIFVNDGEIPFWEIPVTLFVVEGFGSLSGTVTDASNDEPLADVEVRLDGIPYRTATDEEGHYEFDQLPAWNYRVSVNVEDFNPYLSDEFELGADDDIVLDIELRFAACQPSRNRIEVNIPSGEEEEVIFSIFNPGSGELTYEIESHFGGGDAEPWEERGLVNAAEQADDDRLQGVEFVGDRFYVSGGNDGEGRGQIHIFSRGGEYVESFDQFRNTPWGMRDLAWDGELLWGADEGTVFGFTTEGEEVVSFQGPFDGDNGINRSMTWDDERALLWVCDINSDIVGIDREGNIVNRIQPEGDLHVYGLGIYPEDPDDCNIYLFSKDGDFDCQVNKLNPENGEWAFVADLETPEELKAGGMCITGAWDPMSWVLVGVLQGRRNVSDHFGLWHISTRTIWMTVDEDAGVVPPGERVDIHVIFNTGGFPDGINLEAELVINHNGRGDPVTIPVILHVSEEGGIRERTLVMEGGWNLISMNVTPDDQDIRHIFEPLVENDQLIIVKDFRGRFYLPEHDFNNIPRWEVDEAYFVKVEGDARLVVEGEPIESDRPIQLEVGWNFVAYYPRVNTDARTGFSTIVEHLEIAKDGFGRFYMPRLDFNNIPFLCEGQGYQVRLNDDADLVWMVDNVHRLMSSQPVFRHFASVTPTGQNMSLLLECAGLEPSGEIGIFNKSGLLVGSGVVDSHNRCGIAVWGDDPTTECVDGLQENETFYPVAWNGQQQVQVDLALIEGVSSYRIDGFAFGLLSSEDSEIPVKLALEEPYPNPFNDWTRISYKLPDARQITISLLDPGGRRIRDIVNGRLPAGSYSTSLHAGDLPSGVYIVLLRSEEKALFRKVLLMK